MIPVKSFWMMLLSAVLTLALWSPAAQSQAIADSQDTPTSNNSNSSGNEKDPFEKFNRAMFEFNDTLDRGIFKPVAEGYKAVLPEPARNCIGNVFSNVGDVWIAANNLLQGKPVEAVSDLCRVVINSTVGLLGCFDVASDIGLVKHNEDLGQTLGRWGIGSGPYLVLPIFGPSTVRDTFGLIGDVKANPVANLGHVRTRNSLLALRFVDARASLLSASDILEKVALDRYTFVRDAYLQRRRNLIYDGDPPEQSNLNTPAQKTSALVSLEPEPKLQTDIPLGWFDTPTQRDALPKTKTPLATELSASAAL